ncbi:hypothetical protein OG689_16260 [Kitasatospora sp. NBC_00240]|uniref:hypothetical protein n=1 Tax=Kitasatospora sp. NBC_00240 TaxID=2903567 RepID=UPI002255664B|nr:hypothetical protein [Kitasatospora sp. NBC_00240]MCX5210824.1 hypothetical protein [Kitasatospora sp. NBC_00240]
MPTPSAAPAPPAVPRPAPPAEDVRAELLRQREAARQVEPAAAAGLLEGTAREMVARLGRYDRDTLTTWRELAWYRDAAGDPAGALQLLEQVVPDLVQALGHADPDTLQARFELAVLIGTAGNPQGAAHQLHALIPQLAATLGPYDERVLKAQHDLALQVADAGDVAGALNQLRLLVPLVQQMLGEGHPLLAEVRLDLGRYAELWGLTPAGRSTGLGWVEVVAMVHRLLVWDFETDREADASLRELERRTGARDLMDRIFLAPEHLTTEQVAATAFGVPAAAPPTMPPPFAGY